MNKEKNIFFVCTTYHQLKIFFANHVKILSQYGNVWVICDINENKLNHLFEDNKNLNFIELNIGRKIRALSDIKSFFILFYYIYKLRPFLVFSVFPKAGLIAMISSYILRTELRFHVFTGQVWANKTGVKKLLLKLADRLIILLSSHLMTDSPSQSKFLINENMVMTDKISTVTNGSLEGVDLRRFRLPRKKTKGKILRCIYIGRLTNEKGLTEILNVFELFGKRKENITLTIAGVDEQNFIPRINQLALEYNNINYVGHVEKIELRLENEDLLLLPSYREGFGNVVIEAAAMGIPCIGSNIYGLSDSIIHGDTGIKIDAGNESALYKSIIKIKNDPILYNNLSQNAYERVISDFNQSKVLAEWFSIYKRLILV